MKTAEATAAANMAHDLPLNTTPSYHNAQKQRRMSGMYFNKYDFVYLAPPPRPVRRTNAAALGAMRA
jgi:hypothetical protein